MKHCMSKILSALLCLSMVTSLMVAPASAAETGERTIRAEYNESQAYLEDFPVGYNVKDAAILDIGTGTDVEVTVTSGDYTATSSIRPVTMSGTLPNGTVYSLTESGSRIVSLTAPNLQDDIAVSVTAVARSYSVIANSGPAGFKDNLGSTGDPTCTISKDSQIVNGNESWAVTFNPNAGLVIQSLNIRNSLSGQNIIPVSKDAVSVDGTDLKIAKNADGSVTVSAAHAAGDLYITALTVEKAAKLTLDITTGSGITSDVETCSVDAGTSKNITFTPAAGFMVDVITITDGNVTRELGATSRSVNVNGHIYNVERSWNGKVTLSVPAMSSNVSIQAASVANKGYLMIDASRDIDCNYPNLSLVSTGRNHDIRFATKDDDVTIDHVTIETATDKVVISRDTYRFYLDGRYSYVTFDGDVVRFSVYMSSNMRITVNNRDAYHTVTLKTDSGAKFDGKSSFRVEDGDTEEVSFYPVNNETIEKISVTRNGSTTTAKVSAGYISINGVRCPIEKEANGTVTVRLKDITADLTVKAITGAVDKLDYTVTASSDSGATASKQYTYVNSGRSASVTFSPVKNWEIQYLTISRGNRDYKVESGEKSVTINGTKHNITWNKNGKVTVDLRNITANMEIKAVTDYKAPAVDPAPSIPVTPTLPVTPTYTTHAAYLNGYAGGLFNPYKTTSRAQAVVMLTRAFYGVTDATVKGYGVRAVYTDVPTTAWYAPYISFAYDQGILAGVSGTTNGFRPDAPITRGEFTELACRFSGVTPSGNYGYVFPDVSASHVNYNSIGYAASKRWANGYTDGNFRPNQVISRAEIAVMVNRVLGRTADKSFIDSNVQRLYTFSDIPVGYWAYYDILEAANTHQCAGNVGSETWYNI